MGLEKRLAEVDLLIEDLRHRAKDTSTIDYLDGLSGKISVFHNSYRSAKRSVDWGGNNSANLNVGQFALTAKNIADNLSGMMQTLYGAHPVKLTNLERNLENAPKSEEGESLKDIFLKYHDGGKTSPLILARHAYGHAEENKILHFPGNAPALIGDISASRWLSTNVEKYLSLVKDCLEVISEQDSINFDETRLPANVVRRAMKNYAKRHRGTLVALLSGASIALGSLGTMFANNIDKMNEFEVLKTSYEEVYGHENAKGLEEAANKVYAFVDSCNSDSMGELYCRGMAPGTFDDRIWDGEFIEFKKRVESGELLGEGFPMGLAEAMFMKAIEEKGYEPEYNITWPNKNEGDE
ncbi:hypothetical protein HOG16_02445 [Candidatus Woesearchaeota archaeon]|jgi:hypothetical protein|nr:hypothetical protein [Candidatus Woesearchaeota archaeon]MBT4321956.1 hypothetical protein [Candidatus Woesearchaeota archaeon]MBT4631308.1 hypothetical protein [Candidatus Woesearchaeota archaeon]